MHWNDTISSNNMRLVTSTFALSSLSQTDRVTPASLMKRTNVSVTTCHILSVVVRWFSYTWISLCETFGGLPTRIAKYTVTRTFVIDAVWLHNFEKMNATGRKQIDANKPPKDAKCGICTLDFIGSFGSNLPVKNPCGCFFHGYCLNNFGRGGYDLTTILISVTNYIVSVSFTLNYSYSDSFCAGSKHHRTNTSQCPDCKDLQRQVKHFTTENTKLEKKVAQLSTKSSDTENLRKEIKALTSENSKLKKKVGQLCKILSK